MVKRLLFIVTLPGPVKESKSTAVAPPTVSVIVLLAIFTVELAPSDMRKPVPFAASQLTVLPVRFIWEDPAITNRAAVSVPPVDSNPLLDIVIVDKPDVEALLTNRPVLPPR